MVYYSPMENYTKPPVSITESILKSVSEISERVGRLSVSANMDARPHLRRNNRIRSIHSSLAIEANSLSLDEVHAVLDGRAVVGPEKEIREVQNAFRAYEEIGRLDPYSLDDLKRVHGLMTETLVAESGRFRTGNEGVFDGSRVIFVAPPPQMVAGHMDNLFAWLRGTRESVHQLIASSVFHYEFVFIHPFADGNGRMARLWQTALLAAWRPIFRYLPLESQIHRCQAGYYDAIAECHRAGESTAFVEFILARIAETLEEAQKQTSLANAEFSEQVKRLLGVMDYDVPYTATALLERLGLKSKETLRRHYLEPAIRERLVSLTQPDKPTSRNQRYVRIS